MTTHSPMIRKVEIVENSMDFHEALDAIVERKVVRRKIWEEVDCRCTLSSDDRLCIHRDGQWRPWIVNLGDILGEDWVIVREGQ